MERNDIFGISSNGLKLINDWLSHIDKGYIVGAIFLDLNKALDVVDHEILLQKLAFYGVRGTTLRWFEPYISNRFESIVDGLKMSSCQSVKSGVPPGSVLGPVLSLIFINDMPLHLQTDIDIYADDTITHTAGRKLEVNVPKLQISEGELNTWCIKNNMGVHYDKTH